MSLRLKLSDVSTFTPNGRGLSKNINFEISAGELAIIEGENGSGKTTLIKSILGSHKHYKGLIECRVLSVSYLPQLANVQFFFPLTVMDVIFLQAPKASREDVLAMGFIQDAQMLDRPWNTASGGERQKAMLTRTLLDTSELLILDEPFNHLDHQTRKHLNSWLNRLKDLGCAILLIAHENVDLIPNQRIKIKSMES